MTNDLPEAVQRLDEIARHYDATVVDAWGFTRIRIDRRPDLEDMREAAALPEVVVDLRVGDDEELLRFSADAPTEADRTSAAKLTSSPTEESSARAALDGFTLVNLIADRVAGAEIRFERRGWARTNQALKRAGGANWSAVAETLSGLKRVEIQGNSFDLQGVVPRGPIPVLAPEPPRPTNDDAAAAWDSLRAIADAAAWAQIATTIVRDQTTVKVALHPDQDPEIHVAWDKAAGGLDLLRWLRATTDANRVEALRHVLRQATATAGARLPAAKAIRSLAERQRIALARDNAAEVQRAISEGHKDASASLLQATTSIADLIQGMARSANATIVAALGVVALAGRNAATLPLWLVWLVAAGALSGLIVALLSGLRRLDDQALELDRTRDRLLDDPLLPDRDKEVTRLKLQSLDVNKRVRVAKIMSTALTAFAIAIVIGAAVWLGQHNQGAA